VLQKKDDYSQGGTEEQHFESKPSHALHCAAGGSRKRKYMPGCSRLVITAFFFLSSVPDWNVKYGSAASTEIKVAG